MTRCRSSAGGRCAASTGGEVEVVSGWSSRCVSSGPHGAARRARCQRRCKHQGVDPATCRESHTNPEALAGAVVTDVFGTVGDGASACSSLPPCLLLARALPFRKEERTAERTNRALPTLQIVSGCNLAFRHALSARIKVGAAELEKRAHQALWMARGGDCRVSVTHTALVYVVLLLLVRPGSIC